MLVWPFQAGPCGPCGCPFELLICHFEEVAISAGLCIVHPKTLVTSQQIGLGHRVGGQGWRPGFMVPGSGYGRHLPQSPLCSVGTGTKFWGCITPFTRAETAMMCAPQGATKVLHRDRAQGWKNCHGDPQGIGTGAPHSDFHLALGNPQLRIRQAAGTLCLLNRILQR